MTERKEQKKRNAWNRGKLIYTADQISRLFDEYCQQCNDRQRLFTFEGFAVYLDVSPQTLYRWMANDDHKYDEASDTLKRCMAVITDDLQQRKDAMSIFRLKQQIYGGYQDKQVQETSGTLSLTIQGSGQGWGK